MYRHQNLPQYRVSGLVLMLRGSQTQKLKFKEELRSLDSIHQAPRRLQGCLWNRLEEQVYNIGILLTVTLITLILIMDDLYIFYSKMAAVKSENATSPCSFEGRLFHTITASFVTNLGYIGHCLQRLMSIAVIPQRMEW